MAQAESERMCVVMFPWLAPGHISPYTELAKRLVASASDNHLNVVVHLVSTPVNLASLAHHQTDRIKLVELHLPVLPDLPPALHTTKGLPARLMPVLKRACDLAAPRFGALLDELTPDILVYDFIQPWAPLEAEARGVPAVHFATCGAAAKAFFAHCLKTDRHPSAFPFETISLGGVDEDAKYTAMLAARQDSTALVPERDRVPLSLERSSGFVAIKSCADIEENIRKPEVQRLANLLFHVFKLIGGPFKDVGNIFDLGNKMGGGWVKKSTFSDNSTIRFDTESQSSVCFSIRRDANPERISSSVEIQGVLHVAESYDPAWSDNVDLAEVASRVGDKGDAAENEHLARHIVAPRRSPSRTCMGHRCRS
uniref:Flavanone 7-O-glucoside 2''-O-beta-L-rhamnosyltransferase n=1 Tax=Aegilops tauschii TaxID=37682 RepID=M8BGS8_AEGTA